MTVETVRRENRPGRTTVTGAERITVALTARVSEELQRLRNLTGLSKTDLVNRALSLYLLTETHRRQGQQLAFYNPETKELQIVHLA